MRIVHFVAGLVLAAVLSGCDFGVHWVTGPMEDRVLRAESGDRFYLQLEEGGPEGRRWSATCKDSDIDVTIDHQEDCAKVEIRVHRGFDGPSMVDFRCRRRNGALVKEFTISLYKRTGDAAFWKK